MTDAADRPGLRSLGLAPAEGETGPLNAITDVAGVLVGQVTRHEGESRRTGVTAILPHGGNLHAERVPAGLFVANGHGKAAGLSQLAELGEIETPVVLVNTLAVGRATEAVIDHVLARPGNEAVRSVNAVVGETNDAPLNDIRRRGLDGQDVLAAIAAAAPGPVQEGCVGAGTGTVALGWKAGIGTASRRVAVGGEGFAVGVLLQANYGGRLSVWGRLAEPGPGRLGSRGGSVIVVLATDAPLSDRNLARLAFRSMAGIARTGADFSNGSGDYAIAFSTHPALRRPRDGRPSGAVAELGNGEMNPLFRAAADATEEAALNALAMAVTTTSRDPATGREIVVPAFDFTRLVR